MIHEAGMTVNAGHGLNLDNLPLLIEHVPHLGEISVLAMHWFPKPYFYGTGEYGKRVFEIMMSN